MKNQNQTKRNCLSFIFTTLLFTTTLFGQTSTAPSGTGTETDPYLIATLDNLYWMTQNSGEWSKYYEQTADIDASSTSGWDSDQGWTPIGFSGTYDGGNHTIDQLFINRPTLGGVGFFGSTNNATIKDLGLSNVDITGSYYTGALSGYDNGSTTTITGCFTTGSLTGAYYVAGLLGAANSGLSMSSSYSTVTVTADYFAGGLVGQTGSSATMTNCYYAGLCTAGYLEGGLIGGNGSPTVTNSFWDTDISDQPTTIGGGTGKTTAEMTAANIYVNAGWDFEIETVNGSNDIWDMDNANTTVNSGYPFFSWENGSTVVYDLPVVVTAISDITTQTTADQVITLTATDADGGSTTFGASSSDETIATVSISGTSTSGTTTTASLTISNVAEGTSTITVTASNANSPMGSTTFMYQNDVTLPTGTLAYTVSGASVASVDVGDVVLITASFNENIADSPVMQISGSGVNTITATDMTKVDATTYTYSWTVASGSGTQTWTLETGTDLSGNVITSTPTSGSIMPMRVAPSGSGTETDPYLIATLENLLWFSQANSEWNKYYEQTADIDASSTSGWDSDQGWTPIGFSGTYDGGNHTIDQLFINRPTLGGVGFFGSTNNATIKDLGLSNVDITGSYYTGALSGYDNGSTTTITGCFTTGSLTGAYYVAGLLGAANSGLSMSSSYSTVTVTADYFAGGLVGQTGSSATMTNCYYAGLCTAGYLEGGLIGGNGSPTVTNSFWDTDISDQPTTIGGGTGKTTAEMKDVATYTSTATTGLSTAWDFTGTQNDDSGNNDYWVLYPEIYPIFTWQNGMPYFSSISSSAINVNGGNYDSTYTVTFTGTDPNGEALSYSADYSGSGSVTLSVSAGTQSGNDTPGTLEVTPSTEGTGTITISAQDSSNTIIMTIAYLDNRTYDSFRLESLGTLVAWYDGNDPHGTGSVSVGDEIETWVDKSENNIHVTQSESDKRPVVVAEGNNYSLQFDGNDMLGVDNATMEEAFSEYTFISVVKSSVSGYKNIMGRNYSVWEYQWHGAAKINMYINNREQDGSSDTYPFDGQARIGLFRYHDANDALDQWIDGTSTFTNNHNQSIPSSTNDFYIGARMGTGEFFNGEMLELIVFSEYLTNTNRERVENYLANKWGLNGDDLEPEDGEEFEVVNVAPSLAALADASTDEETASVRVLSATDADGDALTYSASSDTSAVTATVSNDTLTLTPAVNWNGIADVMVTVSDGAFLDTTSFTLTVNAVNDAPFVSTPVPDVTIDEDDFGAVIITALEAHFNDVDLDDDLSFNATALGTGLDSLSLSDDGMPPMGRFAHYGSAKIMTIKRSVKKNAQAKVFTLGQAEDKSALMDIVSINNPVGQGRFSSRTDSTSLIVYPTEDFFGNVDIVITATDSSGEFATDTLNLTIENLNDAPSLAAISDASTDEEMASVHVLSATDADGDTLTYSATSDTTAVTATVSNDTLTLTPAVNWNGTANVTVSVSDGALLDTTSFTLTVNAVNDAPSSFDLVETDAVITITESELSTGSLDLEWEGAEDVDGDSITYHFTATLTVGTYTEQMDSSLADTNFSLMSYQELYDKLFAMESTTAELEWNVTADDAQISTPAGNGPLTLTIDVSSLSIDDELMPDVFALHQNYPNPFNPVTNIRFDVPENSMVTMVIYDLLGQKVKTLVNYEMNAGFHSIQWNGTNDHGKPLASGMYIYRINAGGFHAVKKLVFMK